MKKIYDKYDFSYLAEKNYTIGSNAIKIFENDFEYECKIINLSDHVKQVEKSNNILKNIILLFSFIFIAFIMGSFLGYITDSGEYKIIEYSVQSNDTLWEIASNNVEYANIEDTIQEIKDINGLENGELRVGQTILIPSN